MSQAQKGAQQGLGGWGQAGGMPSPSPPKAYPTSLPTTKATQCHVFQQMCVLFGILKYYTLCASLLLFLSLSGA